MGKSLEDIKHPCLTPLQMLKYIDMPDDTHVYIKLTVVRHLKLMMC